MGQFEVSLSGLEFGDDDFYGREMKAVITVKPPIRMSEAMANAVLGENPHRDVIKLIFSTTAATHLAAVVHGVEDAEIRERTGSIAQGLSQILEDPSTFFRMIPDRTGFIRY